MGQGVIPSLAGTSGDRSIPQQAGMVCQEGNERSSARAPISSLLQGAESGKEMTSTSSVRGRCSPATFHSSYRHTYTSISSCMHACMYACMPSLIATSHTGASSVQRSIPRMHARSVLDRNISLPNPRALHPLPQATTGSVV